MKLTVLLLTGVVVLSLFQAAAAGSSDEKSRVVPPEQMDLTVVYDNYGFQPALGTAWGFSCLVEGLPETILFDTGGNGELLLANMNELRTRPEDIDILVLSHIHGDHTGGLEELLKEMDDGVVYTPYSFPASFRRKIERAGLAAEDVKNGIEFCPGARSTGVMGAGIKEQALVLDSPRGAVLITGCAHPGIVNMLERAAEITDDRVYLVLGGFHLASAGSGRIKEIVESFRELGVEKVAPCHCSGDRTRELFREAYGTDFIAAGAGKVVEIKEVSK